MLKPFCLGLVLATTALLSQSGGASARPLSEGSGYPIVSNSRVNELVCYAQTEDNKTLNLGRLCGEIPIETLQLQSGDPRLLGSGLGASGSSALDLNNLGGSALGGGRCDYSWQVDAAGNLCGNRAADRREGGRLGGTPNYTPSSGSYSGGSSSGSYSSGSGGTYVRGYTRRDGTRVRGYTRRR